MKDYCTQFPLLKNHPNAIYLDSSATALKPGSVLEAEQLYGAQFGTNATRGLYPLAEKTSAIVEEARAALAGFLHCDSQEIIFTGSTTSAINTLARSFEDSFPGKGSEIIVSVDAHHSLILPWAELARRKEWSLKISPVKNDGHIDAEAVVDQISERTKIVALASVSNVYGVINNVSSLVQKIRAKNPGVFIVLDAAQAVAHFPFDTAALDVDALAFSGHKLYGPTGIGALYLKASWQEKLSPGQFGGGMVLDTDTPNPHWKTGPEKFEAGTLPLAQIFGLKRAVEFIQDIGFQNIQSHEQKLVSYALEKLQLLFGESIHILGSLEKKEKIGLISFMLDGAHPHDIATLLGEKNICVRAGEHCASFLHRSLAIPATTRISFGIYTTEPDIDTFAQSLREIYSLLKKNS